MTIEIITAFSLAHLQETAADKVAAGWHAIGAPFVIRWDSQRNASEYAWAFQTADNMILTGSTLLAQADFAGIVWDALN